MHAYSPDLLLFRLHVLSRTIWDDLKVSLLGVKEVAQQVVDTCPVDILTGEQVMLFLEAMNHFFLLTSVWWVVDIEVVMKLDDCSQRLVVQVWSLPWKIVLVVCCSHSGHISASAVG